MCQANNKNKKSRVRYKAEDCHEFSTADGTSKNREERSATVLGTLNVTGARCVCRHAGSTGNGVPNAQHKRSTMPWMRDM